MSILEQCPDKGTAVYELLARCYAEPEQALPEKMKEVCETCPRSQCQLSGEMEELRSIFYASDNRDLLVEHARLFVGPFELEAPPFGSVYLEGQMMGESAFQAQEIYKECGLQIANDFHSPPDHVVAELEFLAYLCFRQANSEEEHAQSIREKKGRFLQEHIGAWFPAFTLKINNHSRMQFYRKLADLSARIVQEEHDNHS